MTRDYEALPDHPACPFCDGTETELHNPFGGALSVATYWCRKCHAPFEWIKWTGGDVPEQRSSA